MDDMDFLHDDADAARRHLAEELERLADAQLALSAIAQAMIPDASAAERPVLLSAVSAAQRAARAAAAVSAEALTTA